MDQVKLHMQLRENSADLEDYAKTLKKWGEEMKKKEQDSHQNYKYDLTIQEPPTPKMKSKKKKKLTAAEEDNKKHKSIQKDYSFWEKLDVDAELEKIDKEKEEDGSEMSDEYDEAGFEEALIKKEHGNTAFKETNYEDAINRYTEAIQLYGYDATFYANRAMCYLKLNKYKNAESDCTKAIQIDKEYVKAYYRRAVAREALKQYAEAKQDLLKALKYEPLNKESKILLDKVKVHLPEPISAMPSYDDLPKSKFAQRRDQQSIAGDNLANILRQMPSTSNPSPKMFHFEGPAFKDKVIEHTTYNIEPQTLPKTEVSETTEAPPKLVKGKCTKGIPIKNKSKWPSGHDVELFRPIIKAPKDMSKTRFLRVPVNDVDNKTVIIPPYKYKEHAESSKAPKEPQTDSAVNQTKNQKGSDNIIIKEELQNVQTNFDDLDYSVDVSKEDFSKLGVPIPNTSVNFVTNWRLLKNDCEKRFLYLRQVNPTSFSTIFRDSLDSRIFSEIIECLSNIFIEKGVHVFNYLYGLTKVKRFSTLVMFKSKNDTEGLLKLIDFMRTDVSRSKADINNLIKKYEM